MIIFATLFLLILLVVGTVFIYRQNLGNTRTSIAEPTYPMDTLNAMIANKETPIILTGTAVDRSALRVTIAELEDAKNTSTQREPLPTIIITLPDHAPWEERELGTTVTVTGFLYMTTKRDARTGEDSEVYYELYASKL
jgi:hypothetical protein